MSNPSAPRTRPIWHTSPALGFVVRFALCIGVFYAVLLLPAVDRMLYTYLAASAWVSHVVLNLLGFGTELDRIMISSEAFSVVVRRGCDAVEPVALFVSAVLAFPAPWARKMVGEPFSL